jgi:hypothetical protein
LLMSGGQKLLEMITILLNKIINGEKVPEEWKVAIITLIHKKGISGNVKIMAEYQLQAHLEELCGWILAKLVEL